VGLIRKTAHSGAAFYDAASKQLLHSVFLVWRIVDIGSLARFAATLKAMTWRRLKTERHDGPHICAKVGTYTN
jgi:hypothetical protein